MNQTTLFFEKLFSRSRSLLAVETDGFGLRAAVLTKARGVVSLEKIVTTRKPDPDAALTEVFSALRAEIGLLPKEVILLTATVIPAILNLPVAPGRPRSYKQMQEMVRWEMEPFFVQRVGIWKLETIFIRRGYLRLDQVTLAQREECLAIQKQLEMGEDEMVCGWASQSLEPATRAGSKSPWLVYGMGRANRLRWGTLFEKHGLALQGIYPLVSCAAAALNGNGSTGMVMEARGGMTSCVRLEKGSLSSLQLLYTDTSSINTTVPLLGQPGQEEMALYCAEAEEGIAPLKQKQDAQPIPVAVAPEQLPEGMHPSVLSGMLGAARHRWGLSGGERITCIAANDPGPPLWQRPQIWWIGISILTLLVIGSTEGVHLFQRRALFQRHAELMSNISGQEKIDQATLDLQNEVTVLNAKLTARRGELQILLQRKKMLDTSGLGRADRMVSLLDQITSVLPDTVTLTRVVDALDSMQIEARAFSGHDLANFTQNLEKAMTSFEMKVNRLESAMKVTEELSNLADHLITLQLIPMPPQASSQETLVGKDLSPIQLKKMMQGVRDLISSHDAEKETE